MKAMIEQERGTGLKKKGVSENCAMVSTYGGTMRLDLEDDSIVEYCER